MDGRETLEAIDSVVLAVWYYCCAHVVYVVHVAYVMLRIYSVYTCCLCNAMYRVV